MMRIKLRHAPLFAGSLFLAACGDDTTNLDTDVGSSGDEGPIETGGNPTTLDPDSSGDGTSVATTSTATITDPDSSSDDGPGCTIPVPILADPSFEGGPEGTEWGNASSAFGTPVCDAATCGDAATAQDGDWFVWVGGSPTGDVGGVSQEVTIGESDALTLGFYFQYGAVGSGADVMQLQIDGDVLWEVGPADAADYADWTLVEVDVSTYADGDNHDIDFTAIATNNANLFLDNIQLVGCAGGSVTASDTVDDVMSATDTDPTTDTDTGPGGMLMCTDIGGAVPVAEDGTNMGATNEVVGSCNVRPTDFGGPDVGYTWTAPATGLYRFDTVGSPLDTVLYLLDACDATATELACNDDIDLAANNFQSSLVYAATEGQVITIVVDGWDSASVDDFVLNINAIGCEDPTDLGNMAPVEQADDNTGAGDEVAASCGGSGGEDVIYTWTAPATGIYDIYALSLQMSPVVSAYSGTCGDPSAEIGCATGDGLAAFSAILSEDQQISIVVDGASANEAGTFELNIEQSGELSGDCCVADDSAGCEDAAVTQCTCDLDLTGVLVGGFPEPSDCCSGDWTAECASLAATQCGAEACTFTGGGSCCIGDSEEPGCDVEPVQDCVCAFDDFCCGMEWDDVCVAKAELFCFAECG